MSTTNPAPDLPTAQERLARSRTSMTQWLGNDAKARSTTEHSGSPGLARWLKGLSQHPLAALTIDALTERWARHPLHTSVQLAEVAANQTIAPLVRRHPVLVLGSAAVAGALLVRARPWRWLLRPALLAGIASQVAAQWLGRATASPSHDNAAPSYSTARQAPMSSSKPRS
jgi:hypothetical protein